MATGIMITGPSGSGKTTLGKMVAEHLGFAFVDIDEYIWRKDTETPFSVMYAKSEKISRLMEAISDREHFVMAGSMNSFHEYFDPFFELVIYLYADTRLRVDRVHERELKLFGERIVSGDMQEEHQKFLNDIAGYEHGTGGATLQKHKDWLNSLHCQVLPLNGADALEKNLNAIVTTYKEM